MEKCIFCDIVGEKTNTRILYQDQDVVVFNDLYPKAQTHLLVVTREHLSSLQDLEDKHVTIIGNTMCNLKNIARDLGLVSFRAIINTGSESGQEIFHLHLHLLSGDILPGF